MLNGASSLAATSHDDGGTKRVDHGTMFWHAANEDLVDPQKSVQVGLRTHNPDTMGFHILDAPWLDDHGADAAVAEIKKVVGASEAYITFDIDCLDPGFAPGTGTPVCGGPSTATVLQILRGLAGTNLVGADVVEVAPAYTLVKSRRSPPPPLLMSIWCCARCRQSRKLSCE